MARDMELTAKWLAVAARTKNSRPCSDAWWAAKLAVIEIQYRQHLQLKTQGRSTPAAKKLKLVRGLLENLRLVTPQLGGPKFAPRFAALARKVGLKTGR